jgi:ABC-2 type transport system permease protein
MPTTATVASGSLTWFATHEIRLAWREWLAMMTAGRSRRARNIVVGLGVFAVLLHLLAYTVVGRFAGLTAATDVTTLIVITASVVLAWLLMLSQAIESVTRIFYTRHDLDLIMSSPVALAQVFSIRMAAIALTVTAMALLIAAPFIDVLALIGGVRWLAAYGVVVSIGISATAMAIAITMMLFRVIGPARTRLVAQIVAAIIGAGFVIALQIAAILSYGTLSRFAVLTSDAAAALAPGPDHIVWWPTRAVFGDGTALLALLSISLVLLGAVMAWVSPRFGADVLSASSATAPARSGATTATPFRPASRQQALRRKEFVLLRRDPWLLSQSLMQLLYLVPPALMLWRSFADSTVALVLITPVIVMAAGQLAGGLAWLTISGEDASDLIAAAPLPVSKILRAKIEVVVLIIAAICAPLVVALSFASVLQGAVTAAFVLLAAGAATAIQLWFRVQARRSQFRRRQTSSRIATFAEAFSSVGWAATSVLALVIPVLAAITATLTVLLLLATWKISPKRG